MTNVRAPAAIDPITLEVVRHSLVAILDELEANLTRTAFSQLIYEYKDYALGFLDAEGRMLAQSSGGLPIFLADLGSPLLDCIEVLGGLEAFRPGDAVIHNWAPVTGQHLNNVNMYAPVFADGRPVAFVGARVHWADIGGKDLGSAGNDTTDIFQEGTQFRALRICKGGQLDPEIMRVVECNTRLPEAVRGDLLAQLASCRAGERRLQELIAKYGWPTIARCVERIWAESELLARQAVERFPDGTYEAESFLDDDGVDIGKPLRIKATVIVRGSEMTIDFTGMNPQVRGPFNSGLAGGGVSAAKVAFKYVTTGARPADQGAFANLKVVIPEGTMVSAGPAAPLSRWSTPLATVVDTILHACAAFVPDRVPAGHYAQLGMYIIGGRNRQTGRIFKHMGLSHGGWGGDVERDGFGPGKTLTHGDNLDIPIELQEAVYPFAVESYSLLPDTGGAGRRRGGVGTERVYTMFDDIILTTMLERTRMAPWGLFGGKEPPIGIITVEEPGQPPRQINKVTSMPLRAGSRVQIRTSGGGGYGEPFEREPERVRLDVEEGLVSPERARLDYGVAIDPQTLLVDESATARLRRR